MKPPEQWPRWVFWPAVVAIAFIGLFLWYRIAFAHNISGEGDWLRAERNADRVTCCGPGADCQKVVLEEVEGGFVIRDLEGIQDPRTFDPFVPYAEIRPSKDEHSWVCIWSGKRQCVFRAFDGV